MGLVPMPVVKAGALDTGTFGVSEAGAEKGEAESELELFGGEPGFSVTHVGPSLDGVLAGATVAGLLGSAWGLNLETWVFVGRSRNGELVFVERDLKCRKENVVLIDDMFCGPVVQNSSVFTFVVTIKYFRASN